MTDEIKGRARGGAKRAANMTPEQRKAQAMKMVEAKKELALLPKATHGSADHPLKIGDIEIPCFVLDDGRRVLLQSAMLTALNMRQGTAGRGEGDRIVKFLSTKSIKLHADKYLGKVIISTIKFKTLTGIIAHGYEATVLADICDAVLEARKTGDLHHQQEHIAKQCEILVRGFARVGIIALIDEATGYQKDRARDALAKILEAYVAKELQPYVKTFDAVFYEQMFRLRELPYPPEKISYRPSYFGHLTNDVVYSRLAPGILKALKEEAKKEEKKTHLHRHLTPGYGKLELIKHLSLVIAYMRDSADWKGFIAKLNKYAPRFNETLPLNLDEADR